MTVILLFSNIVESAIKGLLQSFYKENVLYYLKYCMTPRKAFIKLQHEIFYNLWQNSLYIIPMK